MATNNTTTTIDVVHGDDAERLLAHLARVADETDFLSFAAVELSRSPEEEEQRIVDMARRNTGFMLKACPATADEVIGLTTVRWVDRSRIRHVGEFALTVVREWWGKGVGRRLAERAIVEARDSGISRLELRVREDNSRAIALYESLGFRHEGRLVGAFRAGGHLHDELFMGAPL